jgi:predicted TIM-barrel fold metal-dependent hydrolase
VSGSPPTGDLFAEDAVIQELETGRWERGRERIDRFLGFMPKAVRYVPHAYGATGASGYVAGTVRRGESAPERMNFLLGLTRWPGGEWQIGAEVFTIIPPAPYATPITADQLIEELDDAGIRRGVVLSVAYWFGSPFREPPPADEYASVRAENDWTVEQVARYPDRLVAFIGVNPLKDYAIAELERCAPLAHVKGVKVHLANSGVDVKRPEHVEQLRRVFRAANDRRLALVVHARQIGAYTREHAGIILNQVLPAAPDVPVQIAHMGSGAPAPDGATAVFADALAAGDPRAQHLCFDVAGTVLPNGSQAPETLAQIATALRRIGLQRIFFGSDMSGPGGNPPPREHWKAIRRLPLTNGELGVIASNVPPYLR